MVQYVFPVSTPTRVPVLPDSWVSHATKVRASVCVINVSAFVVSLAKNIAHAFFFQ